MTPYKTSVKLNPGQELLLVPFGDVHYNVAACDKVRFQKLIDWLKRKEDAGNVVRLIGMGDYNDAFSPSERRKIKGADLHDTTYEAIDDMVAGFVETFADVMKPLHKNIIGLVGHHHQSEYSDRGKFPYENSDDHLADLMGCPYFGVSALIKLVFEPSGLDIKIAVHHGWGGGRTAGYLVTKRQQFGAVFPAAQLILMGHDHHKFPYPNAGLDLDEDSPDGLRDVKRHFIATGSFLRGYTPGKRASYVEKAGLMPADLGVVIITMHIEEGNDGRKRIDWHTSV